MEYPDYVDMNPKNFIEPDTMNSDTPYPPQTYGQLAVKTMIWINVVMFVISLLFSGKDIMFTFNPFFAFTPSMDVLKFLGASGTLPIVTFQTWWSLITANWLHGSLLHILFNMMALKTVSPLIVKEFGVFRMFTIFTVTGMAGFLLSYAGNVPLTVGASGGICGLIGAALFYGKSRGGDWGQFIFKQTSGWVFGLALIGFLLPNINNWSHGGGLITGICIGWLFDYNERRKESLFDRSLAMIFFGLTLFFLTRSVIQGATLIFG